MPYLPTNPDAVPDPDPDDERWYYYSEMLINRPVSPNDHGVWFSVHLLPFGRFALFASWQNESADLTALALLSVSDTEAEAVAEMEKFTLA
jgi:hypothetical protein